MSEDKITFETITSQIFDSKGYEQKDYSSKESPKADIQHQSERKQASKDKK